MFVARDTEGTLIWADEANKQTDYFCPVCSGKLILRAGEVNAHHFAHEAGACPDHWHYDMSDWHKTMQEQFPIECREVVMKHNGEIHRADIFKDSVNAWVSICFYFGTIETGEDKPEYAIRRVNWSHVDHMSWKPTYKYFDVDDDHEIHMSGKMDMLDFFRTTIEMMRKRLAKEPQQQFLRVVDRHRGFLAPCPKGKANGGMRTYGCRDCESFICSMTCVSGGSSGVYCAYPAQANTYGDWDTDYRV